MERRGLRVNMEKTKVMISGALICMAAGATVTAVTCVTLKKVRKAKMMQAAA